MKITINNELSIRQIQEAFSTSFPGLKLEFVREAHAAGEGSSREDIIKGNKTVGELSGEGIALQLEIHKEQTVSELEAIFRDHLGLNVQVFRKAGLNWIETVNTDHWTIAQQLDSVR